MRKNNGNFVRVQDNMLISRYDNLPEKIEGHCALGAQQLEFVQKVGQSKKAVLTGRRRLFL